MRDIGATWLKDQRCRFRVWAPRAKWVQLHIVGREERFITMMPSERGYHQVTLDNLPVGTRYKYWLGEGREFPDPASSYQPDGVHGPSEVIPGQFPWTDQTWHGIPIERYVIYELHTGTFSPEGTFDSIMPHLPELVD